MKNNRLVKISKYLSKHRRHSPDRIGLELQPGGWVSVEELLVACKKHKFHIFENELKEVVEKTTKNASPSISQARAFVPTKGIL